MLTSHLSLSKVQWYIPESNVKTDIGGLWCQRQSSKAGLSNYLSLPEMTAALCGNIVVAYQYLHLRYDSHTVRFKDTIYRCIGESLQAKYCVIWCTCHCDIIWSLRIPHSVCWWSGSHLSPGHLQQFCQNGWSVRFRCQPHVLFNNLHWCILGNHPISSYRHMIYQYSSIPIV